MGPKPEGYAQQWIKETATQVRNGDPLIKEHQEIFLKEIAKNVGISDEEYLELVDGKEGEVPKEFDHAAKETLDEALNLPDIITLTSDIERLTVAIDKANSETHLMGQAKGTIEKILADKAMKAKEDEINAIFGSPEKKVVVSNYFISKTVENGLDRIINIEGRTDINYIARVVYFGEIEKAVGRDSAYLLNKAINIDQFDNNPSTKERTSKLSREISKGLIRRFCNGEKAILRCDGGQHEISYDAQVTLSESTSNNLQEALTVALGSFTTASNVSNHDTLEQIALLHSGITEGAILSAQRENPILSIQELHKDALNMRRSMQLYDNRFNLLDGKYDSENDLKDAVLCGYIFGTLDKQNRKEIPTISSIKQAITNIHNPVLKTFILSRIQELSQTANDVTDIIAFSLITETEDARIDGVSILKAEQEFNQYEAKRKRDGAREAIYSRMPKFFIDTGLNESVRLTNPESPSSIRYFRMVKQRELLGKEAAYEILSNIIDSPYQKTIPEITWDDADIVLLELGKTNMDFYRINSLLAKESKLSETQKKLVAKLSVSYLFTASGRVAETEYKAEFTNKLLEAKLITPLELVDVYNTTIAVVDEANRAYLHANPDYEEPPFILHNFINTILLRKELKGLDGATIYRGNQLADYRGYLQEPRYFNDYEGANASAITFLRTKETNGGPSFDRAKIQGKMNSITASVDATVRAVIVASRPENDLLQTMPEGQEENPLYFESRNSKYFESNVYNWPPDIMRNVTTSIRTIDDEINTERPVGIVYFEKKVEKAIQVASDLLDEFQKIDTQAEQMRDRATGAYRAIVGWRDIAPMYSNFTKRIIAQYENDRSIEYKEILELRKLSLPNDIEKLKDFLRKRVQSSINELKSEEEKMIGKIDKLPSLSQEVANRRIKDDGIVELPYLLGENSRANIKTVKVNIENLSMPRSFSVGGLSPLLLEFKIARIPYLKLRTTAKDLQERRRNINAFTGLGINHNLQDLLVGMIGELPGKLESKASLSEGVNDLKARINTVWEARISTMSGKVSDDTEAIRQSLPRSESDSLLSTIDSAVRT